MDLWLRGNVAVVTRASKGTGLIATGSRTRGAALARLAARYRTVSPAIDAGAPDGQTAPVAPRLVGAAARSSTSPWSTRTCRWRR